MKILMVDDHVMVLQGLRNLLHVLAPEHPVDIASDLRTALELCHLGAHELMLLDWHLPEGDGEASLARLREAGCTARVVILSGENDRALMLRAIELGAAGFIPKTYSSEMMLAALQQVLQGRLYLPAEGLRATPPLAIGGAPGLSQAVLTALTPRQHDVYRAAARGLPNKLIARELGIAEATVKAHLSVVYAVLGVRNRTEAALQAARDGTRVD